MIPLPPREGEPLPEEYTMDRGYNIAVTIAAILFIICAIVWLIAKLV